MRRRGGGGGGGGGGLVSWAIYAADTAASVPGDFGARPSALMTAHSPSSPDLSETDFP